MKTIYVNEIDIGEHNAVRGFMFLPDTVQKGVASLFNDHLAEFIPDLLTSQRTIENGGVQFFSKYCQFVVYFNYSVQKSDRDSIQPGNGVTIEVMYFGSAGKADDIFNRMLASNRSGWREENRAEILALAYQIREEEHEIHFKHAQLKTETLNK